VTDGLPERIAVASKNAHKLREIERICADWPVEWLTVENTDAEWPDVDEPHDTYLANAFEKARAIAVALGVPAVADDSGIEVDALGGAPGARSARFAGEDATDEANLAKLLEVLHDVEPEHRTARYRCVAALAWPDGREVWSEGTCEGLIVLERRGHGGFGYDPSFVPDGQSRTMAELTDEEKDAVSHRGRAFRSLRARLRSA
jgi:XTP/dITP diphosphohydrolase